MALSRLFPSISRRARRTRALHLTCVTLSCAALLILAAKNTVKEHDFRLAFNKATSALGVAGHPPTYGRIRNLERSLPQHNLDLPFPEGKHGRYVKFSNQANWIGWNNIFGEM